MEMKTFLKSHWKTILLCVFLVVIVLGVFRLSRDLRGHSLILGNPDNIVVISPNESQDVVIIGDPEHVKVKPNNKH